jgi:proteasome beta subunit
MASPQVRVPLALGATTVGVKCKEGIVLASEKRVSYGFMVTSRSAKKVFKVTDRMAIACAGLIGDMQAIARTLAAEANLYELSYNRGISIRSAAKLLANILFSQRYMPLYSETLLGGIDLEGSHLFVLDPLGSIIEDDYAAIGSGAAIAIAILEDGYSRVSGLKAAEDLAVRAVKAAIERDALSGDGVDVLTVSERGVEERFTSLR